MTLKVEAITSAAQFNEIIASPDFSVIDFWATWPLQDNLANLRKASRGGYKQKVKYYKVDVDELQDVAQECGIQAMPTFMVFKQGEKVDSMKGAIPTQLTTMVQKCQS